MRVLPGYAAVIGDLRASRFSGDRARLQLMLAGALVGTNRRTSPVQSLAPTIGDEFQGMYQSLEEALRATFWVRLHLIGEAEVRFGVGWGMLTYLQDSEDKDFRSQDGPAWWAARIALERATVEARRRHGARTLSTWFVSFDRLSKEATPRQQGRYANLEWLDASPSLGAAGELGGDLDDLINTYLICRDQIVANIRQGDIGSLVDFLAGKSQQQIARAEGVTQSAISQRLQRSGIYAIRSADDHLREALDEYLRKARAEHARKARRARDQ